MEQSLLEHLNVVAGMIGADARFNAAFRS